MNGIDTVLYKQYFTIETLFAPPPHVTVRP
jgi:hypothetical protein